MGKSYILWLYQNIEKEAWQLVGVKLIFAQIPFGPAKVWFYKQDGWPRGILQVYWLENCLSSLERVLAVFATHSYIYYFPFAVKSRE